ncbi:MAG: glycosyltransferase family 2 protein [Candidatus Hodarchaeota archaeon]
MNEMASIIIVAYNHKKYLESCINSVLEQDYPHEVIVVDNCSSDGTAQFIEEKYPNVRLIKNIKNRGYGAGNNLGVKYARGTFIVILNPDTIVNDGWLRELIIPLQKNEKIVTTPMILTYEGSRIETCGTLNHFTGLTFTRGLTAKPEDYNQEEFVSGISGCNFAIKKDYYESVGGFDEKFFIYNEDSDLSWRIHLKHFKILYVPKSKVKHDWELKVSPQKLYHLEKNRYIMLRKYLTWKNILVLFPSFSIAEILTCGYAIKNGRKGIKSKFKAIIDGLTIKVKKENGNKNRLFKSLSATIPIEQLTSNKAERTINIFANKIFKWNYKVFK